MAWAMLAKPSLEPSVDHHLGVGIELHAEAAPVIGGLRLAQALDALGGGIAVGARIAHRLDQLVDDMLGRRHVRIAHAEIDDVLAARARLGLELVDLLEDVRRQPLDSVEIVGHGREGSPPRSGPEGTPLNHRNGPRGKQLQPKRPASHSLRLGRFSPDRAAYSAGRCVRLFRGAFWSSLIAAFCSALVRVLS